MCLFIMFTFEHDVVLSEVEEDLSPNLLCNLVCSVNAVFSIQHNLRLHNRHQTAVLQNAKRKMRKYVYNQWR